MKPVPLQILSQIIEQCYRTQDARHLAMGHMIIQRFFFLLRPGEYAVTASPDATPFRICDVRILRQNIRLGPYRYSEEQLHSATHVSLEFTNQKNGTKGELVGLGRSGHNLLCPC